MKRAVARPPDLPGRGRPRQPLLEPRFLLAAEHGVGWLVLAEIGRALVADGDRRGGLSASIVLAAVDDLHHLLRNHREAEVEVVGFGAAARILHGVAVEVCEDQIDMLAVAYRAIAGHAADGG